LDGQLKEANQLLDQANEQIQTLSTKSEGLRNYYEHKLVRIEQQHASLAAQVQLNAASDTEIATAVNEATQDFAELLQRKEIELLYHSEREEQLLKQLREQNEHPAAAEGRIVDYLQMLNDHGVRFVFYRAGLTPIQIPVGELPEFLTSATAYTAQKLGVTEALYNAWLTHYLMPVCNATTSNGPCAVSIYRVEEPRHFILGLSDCCAEHQPKP
jgi:intracellular sulfur oxidation DsrE/DsrF family protein